MILSDKKQLAVCRSLERTLFRLDDFTRETALFPKPLFAKSWDYVGFLPFNDWFSSETEFAKLQQFLRASGNETFISAAPPVYDVPAVETGIDATVSEYNEEHAMTSVPDERLRGTGLRISPEVLYYDRQGRWAMVADLTHNLLICGMDQAVVVHFQAAFGNVKDTAMLISELESYNDGVLDQRESLLANY